MYVWFFCHALVCRRAVRSRGTYFEQVLCHGLRVDFDVFIVFSDGIALLEALEFSFSLPGGATIFAKLHKPTWPTQPSIPLGSVGWLGFNGTKEN